MHDDLSQQIAALSIAATNLKNEISDEQARVRVNINTVPSGSAPHKRYVAKFDQLETELEKTRQAKKTLRVAGNSR